jgi:bifunctional DNA-binding transcriptional regulator/antitoxin component of YhaV-PrlF toxin-antitoxin module
MEIPREILEKVDIFRENFGEIYTVKINSEIFLVRALTKKEFLKVSKIQDEDSSKAEEEVLRAAVLSPDMSDIRTIDNMLAGTAIGLVNSIINLSGFASPDTFLEKIEENRELMENLDNQIIILICRAFPHIKPSDLDNFNIQKICYYLSLAEKILGVTLEVQKQKIDNKNNKNQVIDFNADNKGLMSA